MLRIAYPRSSEGPSPETSRRRSGEWRPAAAARNRRPREVRDPARQALRPGCEELAALRSGGNAGEGSAAPDRKSPRWSAERRARPAGRAPRLTSADRRARQRDNRNTAPFRRSARASWGGWKRDKQNPGAATRGGNEEDCAV